MPLLTSNFNNIIDIHKFEYSDNTYTIHDMMENEVKILKALADETRLKIVEFLDNEEKCVHEIIPITGKAQPTVSQHLKILREAGIVKFRKGHLREPGIFEFKEGVKEEEKYCYYYSIKDEKIFEMIKVLKEFAQRT